METEVFDVVFATSEFFGVMLAGRASIIASDGNNPRVIAVAMLMIQILRKNFDVSLTVVKIDYGEAAGSALRFRAAMGSACEHAAARVPP